MQAVSYFTHTDSFLPFWYLTDEGMAEGVFPFEQIKGEDVHQSFSSSLKEEELVPDLSLCGQTNESGSDSSPSCSSNREDVLHTPPLIDRTKSCDDEEGTIQNDHALDRRVEVYIESQVREGEDSASHTIGSHHLANPREAVKMRKKQRVGNAYLEFHKSYLIARMEQVLPLRVSVPQLFREITKRGYRGTLRNVQYFMAKLWEDQVDPKRLVRYHRQYLLRRIEEIGSQHVPVKQLAKEIRKQGYRGSLGTLQSFLAEIRGQSGVTHAARPRQNLPSSSEQLTKCDGGERLIQDEEEGAQQTQTCLKGYPPEAHLAFHKDYLVKRLKKSPRVKAPQLLKEIKIQGYKGSLRVLQQFVRDSRIEINFPDTSLCFYKQYLVEKIKEAFPKPVSMIQLFKDLTGQGYRGTYVYLRKYVKTIIQEERSSEACLSFHKCYLTQRFEETWPNCVSSTLLFKEIESRGYRGSLRMVQKCLTNLRKGKR